MSEKIREFISSLSIVAKIIICVALLGIIILAIYLGSNPNLEIIDAAESPFEIDIGSSGNLPDGMVHISINSNPVFTDGVGNVNIVNSGANTYAQMVEIVRNDNDEFIFRSPIIAVGERYDSGVLLRSQKKGVYDCTAIFHSLDEDGMEVETAAAYITVTIE